jgi:hypothetical protein
VNAGGAGKAELGTMPNGKQCDPKKLARGDDQPSTSGCCVVWGDVQTAAHEIAAEGIDNRRQLARPARLGIRYRRHLLPSLPHRLRIRRRSGAGGTVRVLPTDGHTDAAACR